MILQDKKILEYLQNENLRITPLPSHEQIQPASIDLRLGKEYLTQIVSEKSIDPKNNSPKYQSMHGDAIIIPPGEFLLATTIEKIELPSTLIARVEGRSSLARLGIQIHCAGFVDPGFIGQITLELKNIGCNSVTLYEGMRICQIVFEELHGEPSRVYGECGNKYQNQEGVVGSLLFYDD